MRQPSLAPSAPFTTASAIDATHGVPLLARLVTIFLLVGGALGCLSSFLLIRNAWPWSMPDLAFRFLAGAAAAYAVGSLLTLRQPGWRASELLMTTVIIYGIPLGLATLIGSEAIDFGKISSWGFFALVIPAVTIAIVTVARNWSIPDASGDPLLSRDLRVLLLGLGVVATLVGAWVYLAPRESGAVWPWAELGPWKQLDTRLLASMLLTIGVGALLVAWRNRWSMALVFLPMLWAYCVVSSIGLAIHADATPAFSTEDYTYVGIFSAVLLLTLGLFVRQWKASDR
jgi:hypothetical protein